MTAIKQRMAKLAADVEALSEAIQADKSKDQSSIREDMGKLHKQLTELIETAKAYTAKADKLLQKANAEQENADVFMSSAEEMLTSLEAASEAMDPEQWDW
jgi:hypothetical protein